VRICNFGRMMDVEVRMFSKGCKLCKLASLATREDCYRNDG